MSKPKDGGPAFPRSASQHSGSNNGMSLRDYFAAKALQGMIGGDCFPAGPVVICKYAYQIADAMLAEREKERE